MHDFLFKTERLGLRPFALEDAPGLFALNADPEVLRHTGDVPFADEQEAAAFILGYDHYEKTGFGRWTVVRLEDHSFLGWCGLKRHEDGTVDLGFRFLRTEWNKGYATEAARACIEYGFTHLGLDRIIGRAAAKNKTSTRVLEKIGMTYWKTAPWHGLIDPQWYRIEKGKFQKNVSNYIAT
jgi:ribosomal-protein-alanine N-acetyltransferase